MGPTLKARQSISCASEHQSFLPPVDELTQKNIRHVSRSRPLYAQVFPRVWRQQISVICYGIDIYVVIKGNYPKRRCVGLPSSIERPNRPQDVEIFDVREMMP